MLQLTRCPESNIHSRYDFEKSYFPKKGIIFLIFYVSKINFKKPRIEKKNIESNLKFHLLFYFCRMISDVQNRVKTEPPKDSFMSSILEWISNSNETLNSSSRSEKIHTSFGKFLKTFQSC